MTTLLGHPFIMCFDKKRNNKRKKEKKRKEKKKLKGKYCV